MNKKAVVLLSGGMDSATALAMAREAGFDCYALTIDFGQRHYSEIAAAKRVAKSLGVIEHRVFSCPLSEFGGSAQTDPSILVPEFDAKSDSIPVTYVPARNTVFLSIALGWAEILGSTDLFIGSSYVDYSGYPDCRPEYFKAFSDMANLATKAGVLGTVYTINTPLLYLSKAQTVAAGLKLGVDYSQTVSCYSANLDGLACGVCASCALRRKGFIELGVDDTTRYVKGVVPVCA